MTATLLIHFGSPKGRDEVAPFLDDIFADHYGIFAKPIALLARRCALKKYDAVGFGLLDFRSKNNNYCSSECEQSEHESRTRTFLAAQYGQPSIEEALTQIDESGINKIVVIPLYPHASLEMYDSIFRKIDRLRSRYFRGMHFRWAGPFFDHPLFIEAWADALKGTSEGHLLFCAHAIKIPPSPLFQRGVRGDLTYLKQVEHTARAVWQALGSRNPMSIAYQSAAKFGKWSTPSIENELLRLVSKGVLSCTIVPISFLFDNVETLFDIDRVAIPAAIKAGMREVRRARPPGVSEKIIKMFADIVNKVPSPL